jgi:hypothetical protein
MSDCGARGVCGFDLAVTGDSPKAEKPPEGGFFFFYSISSEYQVRRIKLPTLFGWFGGETVWNEGSLLWIFGWDLTNFPHSGGKQVAGYGLQVTGDRLKVGGGLR